MNRKIPKKEKYMDTREIKQSLENHLKTIIDIGRSL